MCAAMAYQCHADKMAKPPFLDRNTQHRKGLWLVPHRMYSVLRTKYLCACDLEAGCKNSVGSIPLPLRPIVLTRGVTRNAIFTLVCQTEWRLLGLRNILNKYLKSVASSSLKLAWNVKDAAE